MPRHEVMFFWKAEGNTVCRIGEVRTGRRVQKLRESSLDCAGEPAPSGELSRDFRPNRTAGFDHIMEDSVHGILIENAHVSVGMDVHFEGFEFEALLVRHVMQSDYPEIGKPCFRANRGVLGDFDDDVVALVLVWPRFNVGKRRDETTFRMNFCVLDPARSFRHSCFIHSN